MAKGWVTIEVDRCKGCSICVEFCPKDILVLATDSFNAKGHRPIEVTVMEECTGCAICAVVCPDVVFTVYREPKKKKPSAA